MAIPTDESDADKYFENLTVPWLDKLITTAKGTPKAILANVITALRCAPEWAGKLTFDAFYQRTMIDGPPPWAVIPERRVWMPADDILATNWMQHQGILVGDDTVNKAIEIVARDLTFHPIVDYLRELEWDGAARLDTWVCRYLGVVETPYSKAVGAKFLISAVARVMRPGCKADCALILEGRQGIQKSTAMRTLFQPHFSDEISELGSKDAAMQMNGVWGIELAELEGMNKAETSKIKAALSRSIDRYRPPWGRRVVDQPRQCVFCGTVNHNTYLRDETGGRRFWPIVCGKIDIEGLMLVRDQLFAEALSRFLEGEPWWLETQVLTDAARAEQAQRRQPDAWDDEVERWASAQISVTPTEFLQFAGFEMRDRDQRALNRVAAILQWLGYERKSVRVENVGPRQRYVKA